MIQSRFSSLLLHGALYIYVNTLIVLGNLLARWQSITLLSEHQQPPCLCILHVYAYSMFMHINWCYSALVALFVLVTLSLINNP